MMTGNYPALCAAIDISGLTSFVATFIYLMLAAIALWGAFCVVMVWMRVARQRFRSEDAQNAILGRVGGAALTRRFCRGRPTV